MAKLTTRSDIIAIRTEKYAGVADFAFWAGVSDSHDWAAKMTAVQPRNLFLVTMASIGSVLDMVAVNHGQLLNRNRIAAFIHATSVSDLS